MFNNNHWLEEQLNHEHRRDLERQAESARANQPETKQTTWQWLQDRLR
jgi:hypothetical protein